MGALVQKSERIVVEAEPKRRLVDRVASSELFQRSPRLREFLLYVAECTIEERLGDVREQVIAERVFRRKPDPGGQDSIVRAEARNLRKRLETYFNGEGLGEPIILVMPKGGYALAFVPRSLDLPVEAAEEEEIEPKSPRIPLEASSTASRSIYPLVCAILAVIAVAALGLSIYWHGRVANLSKKLNIAPATLPFSAIFNDEEPTEIVTSDTGFLQISSSILHRRITLDEYMSRNYQTGPETNPPGLLQNWNVYEFTDGREMTVAGLILQRNAQYASKMSLRSGHSVQLQDFKDHNIVLIGSSISNPWAQLYEDKLNFRCELVADGHIQFKNKFPHAREQVVFPTEDDLQNHRTYARIAFLPKTSDATATLLIAGTTAQSTQAAGEFVTDQAALVKTLRSLGIDPQGQPRFFELLIRTNNFVSGAILREVVAGRASGPPER